MASINIVSKRLQSLSNKRFFYESYREPVIKNQYDLENYLQECNNFCDYASAIQALRSPCLTESDICSGANYIVQNIVPKVSNIKSLIGNDLSIPLMGCKMIRPIINLKEFYNSDTYQPKNNEEIQNKYVKAYNMINEAATEYRSADRVIVNHEALSRRYNFDKIVQEGRNNISNDQTDLVWEICSYIDTLKINIHQRYNMCLENTLYLFNKNGVEYDIENIVESATDYIMMNYPMDEESLSEMVSVLKRNIFFKDTEFAKAFVESYERDSFNKSISNIQSKYDIPDDCMEPSILVEFINREIEYVYSKGLQEYNTYKLYRNFVISDDNKANAYSLAEEVSKLDKIKTKVVTSAKEGIKTGSKDLDDDKNVSDLIEEFKKKEKKDVGAFKNLINKIYAKDPEDAIRHTPTILNLIRMTLVFSVIAFAPITGIILCIVDAVISLDINRKQTEKLISFFKKEREKVEDKMEKSSGEKREKLSKYLKKLDDAIMRLSNYKDDLSSDVLNNDEDDDQEILNDMAQICTLCECMNTIDKFDLSIITDCIREHYDIIPSEFIDSITELSLLVQDVANRDSILESLEYAYNDLLKFNKIKEDQIIERASISSCLYENINKIKTCVNDYEDFNVPVVELAETLNSLQIYLSEENCLLEGMSAKNTFKLAAINIKDKITTLSDKARREAKDVNSIANRLKTKIEAAINNANREAVIRGSILPQFSTLVGMIVASAVAIKLQVHIGIVAAGWLGILACRKGMAHKERELILDEIESEIEVLEKQIAIAEREEDFDKYKQLLILSKKLKREAARIRNKSKAAGRNTDNNNSLED